MEKILLKDFLQYNFLSGLEISTNKSYGAFIVKIADEEKNDYKSNLWIFDTQTNTCKQMTFMHDVQFFIWLDDDTILFSASRDKKVEELKKGGEDWTCFYKLSMHGGEAKEYMKIPLAVTSLKKLHDNIFALTAVTDFNRANFYEMNDTEKLAAKEIMKKNADYEVIDEIPYWQNGKGFTNKKRNSLYIFDKEKDKLTLLSDATQMVSLLDTCENKVLYSKRTLQNKMNVFNALIEYDITTNAHVSLVNEGVYSIYNGGYINESVYFEGNSMLEFGLNRNSSLYLVENSKEALWVDDDISIGNSVGTDCKLGSGTNIRVEGDFLYFTTTTGINNTMYKLHKNSTVKETIITDDSIDCFCTTDKGVYYIGFSDNKLQELYFYDEVSTTQISDFNSNVLQNKYVSKPEHFTYENDGIILDGFVMKPINYTSNQKYPAVLDIHGGPKTVYGTAYFHEMQTWASEGYFVIFCNPRGSDGKGNVFADIRGKYGTIEYDDIMRAVDVALEKYPSIDTENIGVTGGSYGGFMTNWIIGHTDRFKCAASQRSISNWVSMAYTTDIGYYFAEDQVAATPWSDMDKMWEQSPLKYADKVKTPTLFIHSEQDYRCWLPEGLQMFTALKYFNVPARLCMFKGETHELSRSGKPSHRVRRLEELTNWFNEYLK